MATSACKFSLITSSKHSNIHVHVEYRNCDGQGAEIRCLNINESILFVFDRAQKCKRKESVVNNLIKLMAISRTPALFARVVIYFQGVG